MRRVVAAGYDAGVSFPHRPRRPFATLAAAACCLGLAGATAAVMAQPASRPTDGRPYLNEQQIQQIKRAEITPQNGGGLRFRFANDVQRRYAEQTPGLDYGRFRQQPDLQKALAILGEDDSELARDVIVRNDPAPIAAWRQQVQQLVLQGCATSACHGGAAAESFYLHNPRTVGEAASYTNYYLLNTAVVSGGGEGGSFFAAAERPMVNRDRPADSVLLKYMLPPGSVEGGHPTVEKPGQSYDGVVRSTDDPQYNAVGRWIDSLPPLTDPAEAYGIETGE